MPTTASDQIMGSIKTQYSNTHETKAVNPYQYWGKVVRVVDGDTVDIEVELGFEVKFFGRFRLIGVDTPEIFGVKKSSEEYKQGKKAAEYVESVIPPGTWVEIRTYAGPREKYGRWLCEIFVDGSNLNQDLIDKGYAQKYP